MRERGYNQVSSIWKFKNLLVFIAIIIIFGTIILSSVSLREEVSKESKVHNTKAIETVEKRVFVEKMTKINKDINIEANITTIQSGIVLGHPVYWKKNIKLSEPTNVSIELPSTATNISIVKLVIGNLTLNETEINITKTNETNITISIKKPKKEEGRVKEQKPEIKEEIKNKSEGKPEIEKEKPVNKSTKKIMVGISGNIILEDNMQKPMSRIFALFQKIFRLTGLFLIEDFGEENIVVEIEEIVEEVEIEYETPAPYSIEEEQENKKLITIFGPQNIHYENVLAFTELPKEVPENAVRLYWIINETRTEVEITKYDLNNNSLIDYIEWVVPYLSNQSYELIIEISKAEHLNENKTFIEDVYEEVKARDNSWIEIQAQHDLRVTIEQNLTSKRDITIYERSTCS